MAGLKTFEDVKKALLEKGEASIPGVGKLRVIDKAARTARNPATGAVVEVPAKRVVKFSMSTIIGAELNGMAK
jgi:DNA-binding protein HU-beta